MTKCVFFWYLPTDWQVQPQARTPLLYCWLWRGTAGNPYAAGLQKQENVPGSSCPSTEQLVVSFGWFQIKTYSIQIGKWKINEITKHPGGIIPKRIPTFHDFWGLYCATSLFFQLFSLTRHWGKDLATPGGCRMKGLTSGQFVLKPHPSLYLYHPTFSLITADVF